MTKTATQIAALTTYAVFASYATADKGPLLGHVKFYASGFFRYFPKEGKPDARRFTSFDNCLLACLPKCYGGLDGTMSEEVK
jgi:hypothetical protein